MEFRIDHKSRWPIVDSKLYMLNNCGIDFNDTILLKKEYDYFQCEILARNFVFLGHT